MSTAEDIGGQRFRHSTFAYGSAGNSSEPPDEGTLTTGLLVQRGYEVPSVLLASRFLTLGSDDRKSEMILFYLEPAAPGVALGDLYAGEEPTAAWTALRKPLAERSRQVFTIAPPGAPR